MKNRGQSILEYALLLSVLCAVFVAMFAYTKNSMKSRLLIVQDRLNEANQ
ncbi:MAG: hypothetical protein WC732_05810 [Candidatus Omnitrophota bacterium]